MTREEVIKYGIEWLKDEHLDAKDEAFIKIALKALEQEPCEDCIRREAAIRIAEQGQVQGYEWQFKELVKLPSVNPQEPKTGYWEKTTDGYCYWYKCSCCGTKVPKNEWGEVIISVHTVRNVELR